MKLGKWILQISIVALGVGLFMLQSQSVKKSILDFVVNQPFKDSSLRIETGEVRGLFPFQFTVAFLDIKDSNQTIVRLSDIWATWSLPPLINQEVKIYLRKGEELAGDITYDISKHAFFSTLKGPGVLLGKDVLLQSLKVSFPTLNLLKGQVLATLNDGHGFLTLTANLRELDEDRLEIQEITVMGKEIKGKGQGIAFLKQGLWEGSAEATVASLSPYERWFQKGLKGSVLLKGHKRLTGETNLHLVFNAFHYGDFDAKDLEIQAVMPKIGKGRVTVHGQGIHCNSIPLTHLSAQGTVDEKKGNFDVTATGPGKITCHTQGIVTLPTLSLFQAEVTLARAEFMHPLHQFSLREPAVLNWTEKGMQTKKLAVAVGEGSMIIQNLIVGETLAGSIVIDRLPLTLLQTIHPDWMASGFLSGKGTLGGTWDDPHIALSVEGESIQRKVPGASEMQARKPFPRIDVSGNTNLSKGIFSWQTALKVRPFLKLSSEGRVSVTGWQLLPDSLLEAKLKAKGDISALSLFMPDVAFIQGQASVDLAISGTMNKPLVQGHASLVNGLYENGITGTIIRNIQLKGKFLGNTLTLSHITAQDNAKGHIRGQGTLKFDPVSNPDVAIELVLDQFILVQNDDLFGRAKGVLKMNGTLWAGSQANAKITGDLTLHPLEVSLDEPDKKISTIKLQEKRPDGSYETVVKSQKKRAVRQGPASFPVEIKLGSPKGIYILGQGLESQWTGDMQVIGPLTDTQLVGKMGLVQGKFTLFNKPLNLVEGQITYHKDPPNDPLLSIMATRPIGDLVAIMRVESYASHPKITFSSNPAHPQEEVLAQLLFGKGIENISVTQSLLLANALSAFKGKNALNITDKIRAAFGLDVLEFKERKPLDDDDFTSARQQVTVGKQISDKVYLSLDQSISGDGSANATIQIDVTPSLKIEADVGGDKNTGVGFSWIKKY